ncbi:GspH/FimT family pseudopilin [Pseudanabaena sp. FACHB-2040]|uniref:pilus assembly FimT family protein n=1 Tax=Pseudanabaena sp. FACHB-2040 TaxID=2692859 RepID=UPI001684563A|nr:GspH/FimT family pseudopilin [Pseudanabaena sp. FACHB-2040]MBD2257856.1 prepilin-type N-terminal cleavage/methylation domain-containing protein [Pseudanabaena sp. FACHB-2040]
MKYTSSDWPKPALNWSGQSGFTLLESLAGLSILAILAAIALPVYLAWYDAYCLTAAQREIHQAMRHVQSEAIQKKREGQFSIRENGDHLEWAKHDQAIDPAQVKVWKPLEKSVTFDISNTTLLKKQDVYYTQFGYQGDVSARLGRVTLMSRNGGRAKRCVIVSTLIGALRDGREQPTPDSNGRYCY